MLKSRINLICLAGGAKASPKLGQALGPLGINMMQFCKEFNAQTTNFIPDAPLRVKLFSFDDRSYKFKIKPPPTSWFVKRIIMKDKLGKDSREDVIGYIGIKYIYEIAKIKKEFDYDLKDHSLESISSMIINQCKIMGLLIDFNQDHPTPFKISLKL